MKWIGRRHKKFLRRTYCVINGMSRIVRMMQPRASNNRHFQIWGAPEAWSHIRISNENAKFIHFQLRWSLFRKCHMISYDRSSTAYVPITFSNKTVYVIIKYICLSMRYGSLICGKVGALAPIWLKFRCTGTSTLGKQMLRLCHEYPDTGTQSRLDCHYAKWDRHISSDRSVITICSLDSPVHLRIWGISSLLIKHFLFTNLICQLKHTTRYWVPVWGYLWHSRSNCWPKVEVPVHRRILGISSWQIQHCIFPNPIWQSKQTRRY